MKRVYFNVKQGENVKVGESLVQAFADHVYTGKVTDLYDIYTDKLGLIARGRRGEITMNQIESELLDLGFSGLVDSEDGRGVILNGDMNVTYQGTQTALGKKLLREPTVDKFLTTGETVVGKKSLFHKAVGLLSPDQRVELHDALAAVLQHPNKRLDRLAEKIGVTRPMITRGVGAYESGLNPVMLVSLDTADQADLYALAVKYIYEQDAVPWMRAIKARSEATRNVLDGIVLTKADGWSDADMQALIAGGMDGFTRVSTNKVVFTNFLGAAPDAFVDLAESASSALEGVILTHSLFEGEYHDQKDTEGVLKAAARTAGQSDLLDWVRGRKTSVEQATDRFFEGLPEDDPARQEHQRVKDKGWSPERRKEQSERMKAYHAERRDTTARSVALSPAGNSSSKL